MAATESLCNVFILNDDLIIFFFFSFYIIKYFYFCFWLADSNDNKHGRKKKMFIDVIGESKLNAKKDKNVFKRNEKDKEQETKRNEQKLKTKKKDEIKRHETCEI